MYRCVEHVQVKFHCQVLKSEGDNMIDLHIRHAKRVDLNGRLVLTINRWLALNLLRSMQHDSDKVHLKPEPFIDVYFIFYF